MGLWEIVVIALGLSMDAFAVSVCKGLSARSLKPKQAILCGLYFGGFQGAMPIFGFLLGARFQESLNRIDHWIVFLLLLVIGGQMIRESRCEATGVDGSFSVEAMLPLAVATSVDAFAVGVTFAFLEVDILLAAGMIAVTTCILSVLGVWLGHYFGSPWRSRAELMGGCVLILMGLKILLVDLGIIG